MKNSTFKVGLSKGNDIPTLYTYLIFFEKVIKSKSGSYNIKLPAFISFCKLNGIKCKDSIAKKEIDKKDRNENYFFFSTTKNLVSQNDKAHHLLRHIRNSIAHALISKSKNYYYFTDYNSNNNLSMTGKIRTDLFKSFVIELVKSSGLNDYPQ